MKATKKDKRAEYGPQFSVKLLKAQDESVQKLLKSQGYDMSRAQIVRLLVGIGLEHWNAKNV